ncbi:MAG: SH3 domain-containing protein [Clostridiales bacterium]|nr:SH3 domain-containing protein [Clostridiales bacterium]
MPKIYLSPSTQEYNLFFSDSADKDYKNTEEYYMNLIADAMVPYLIANNIQFKRNKPEMSVKEVVAESNDYHPDLHIAIHSNSSPPDFPGVLQGPDIFYFPVSGGGREAANLIAEQFKKIYPNPDLITVLSNDKLLELARTQVPAVYIEAAYHDNESDAEWIKDNIEQIAKAVVRGITNYFGIEFRDSQARWFGEVSVSEGSLNIRSLPDTQAQIVGKLSNGDKVILLRSLPEWYLIAAGNVTGYVSKKYIKPL